MGVVGFNITHMLIKSYAGLSPHLSYISTVTCVIFEYVYATYFYICLFFSCQYVEYFVGGPVFIIYCAVLEKVCDAPHE